LLWQVWEQKAVSIRIDSNKREAVAIVRSLLVLTDNYRLLRGADRMSSMKNYANALYWLAAVSFFTSGTILCSMVGWKIAKWWNAF